MKKIFPKIITAILVTSMSLSLFACGILPGGNKDTDTALAANYVQISINPLVELLTDKNNVVIGVNYGNKDAEILLAETTLIGLSAEEATVIIVRLAAEAGYIDVEGAETEVSVTVVGQDEETSDSLADSITNGAQNFLDENGINGFAVRESLEALRAQAEELGISVYKLKLILAVIAADSTQTIEGLTGKTEAELREMLKGYFEELKEIATELREAYKAQKAAILQSYAEMTALREEIEVLKGALAQEEATLADITAQLAAFEGTEEDRTALETQKSELEAVISDINTQLTAKEAALKTLHDAYKAEIKAAHDTYKEQSKQIREQIKNLHKNRMNQWKSKFENHKNEIKQKKDQLKEQATELGMSAAKLAMINLLVEKYPQEYTFEQLEAMSVQQLINIIKEKYDEVLADYNARKGEFEAAKALIDESYSDMFEMKEELDGYSSQIKALSSQIRTLKEELLKLRFKNARDYAEDRETLITQKTEQIAQITTQIEVIQADFEALKADYEALREAYNTEIDALSESLGDEFEAFGKTLSEFMRPFKSETADNIKNSLDDAFDRFLEQKDHLKQAMEGARGRK